MNIKTITTADGVNAVDFGSGANRYYWFRNLGTTTVYVSGNADISADADGVAELAAGDSVCIETLGGKVYVLGAGKVVIHNTGDKFPPFRNAPVTGGGGSVAYTKAESDARYPLKTDTVPRGLGFGYGICNSAVATVSKSASVLGTDSPEWKRVDHSIVAIKFAAAVPANATLTINNRGSCPIYYHGVKITDGIIGAGDTVTFIYINDIYHVIGIENGGKANSADTLTDWGTRTIANANDAPFGFCAALDCENAPNTFWSTILTTGSSGATKYKTQIAFPWAFDAGENSIRYRCENNGDWGSWQEISTTPIKSEVMSVSTDSSGNAVIFDAVENKKIISINCFSKQAVPFNYNNAQYGHFTENDGSPYAGSASFTVYYIEG